MSRFRPLSRRGATLALALFASLLSCGREVTGPGGRGALVALHVAPDYSAMIDEVDGVMHSVADLVPFTKVRIELRRVDNSVAASEVVNFPSDATEIPLSVNVRLGDAAVDGAEPLTLFLRYINATGDTVFAGGPLSVTAKVVRRGEEPQTVEVPVAPTVPGAVFARVDISPDTVVANTGQTANFTAQGFDSQDVLVPNAIIGFISRNPALVAVPNLGSGTVNLVGVRGTTWLVAQSLTGIKDSAFIRVMPLPTTLAKVSGDAQSALTAAQFAQPLRVRVTAADGLGVADWPVNFAVAAGGGSLSATLDTTDVNGFAEVMWTAGPTAGPGSVTASVTVGSLTTTFTGSQLSTAPSSLAFLTQPVNMTAGEDLAEIQVAVRNGAGQTIGDFTGEVTLSLANGVGASLVGETAVNAVAGVATFSDLTVNKGGSAFKLTATYDQLPPAQSNAFDVAAAPPTTLTVLGGGGQSAPPETELPDSIRVRVTDTFGMPVPGQAVQFTVTQGGGSVSQASVVTDADGRAGVRWTLGAGGPQQIKAALGALEQFVSATAVLGGAVELFSGFDYTDIRVGGSRLIPIFLTNPSPTPVEVTLSVHDSSTSRMAWDTESVVIPPGNTRVDVPLHGLALGGGWAVMRSAVGDDSLLVVVDSANVGFLNQNYIEYVVGDTVRTLVRLSTRAPAGGLQVVVRSADPTIAVVAPSSGRGIPEPTYGGGEGSIAPGVDVTEGVATLLAPLGDSAVLVIPEGQLFGEVAIVVLDDQGEGTSVELFVDAEGFVGSSRTLYVVTQGLTYYNYYTDPASGIGVGQRFLMEFYAYSSRVREQRIRLESSDPLRVVVDSVAIIQPGETWAAPAYATVLDTGIAYVRYWMDNVPMDSALVVGEAPRLRFDGYGSVPEGGEAPLTVILGSLNNLSSEFPSAVPVSVTITSDNPSVALPERSAITLPAGESRIDIPVRMVGAGSANVIVSAPGFLPDTLALGSYQSYMSVPSFMTVGAGAIADGYVSIDYSVARAGAQTITVQSLNEGVAEVITSSMVLGRSNSTGYVVVRGVAAGTTTVRFTGPGIAATDMTVEVVPLTLSLSVPATVPPDGVERNANAYLLSGGSTQPLADTTYAVLRSSDPSRLEVVDSVVVFSPDSYGSVTGRYRALMPGPVTLSLIRPGVDSAGASITVRPYTIVQQWPSVVVGQQLEASFTLYREGPDTLALPITITQSGPGVVSFRSFSGEFADGSYYSFGRFVGESVGVDTLTISVPGYPDVTRVVYVENTSVALEYSDGDYAVGGVVGWIRNRFDVTGVPGAPIAGKTLRYLLTSLDTTRAVVVQDTIVWFPGDQYGPSVYGSVRFKEPGLVSLAITDVDGVVPGDTTEVFVYPAELYGSAGFYGYDGNLITMAMGQRTEEWESWVARTTTSPDPLWVRLESSDPSIVQVPDSVLIPAGSFYGYFTVTAGDTVGSARVRAFAPGYNPWRFDVVVTRGQFGLYAEEMYTDGAAGVEVYAMDAVSFTTRPLVADVAARFTTSRPDFIDTVGATFTFPADSSYVVRRGPAGVAPGVALIGLVDDRGERFDNILPGSRDVQVSPARIRPSRSRIMLTPGLVSASSQTVADIYSARDSLWLRLAAVGDKFTPMVDSILVQDEYYDYDSRNASMSTEQVPLRGLAFGEDTLVLSADGLPADSVIIAVQPGALRVQQRLPNIVVGDSLYVLVYLYDAEGNLATAAESLNISVSVDTTFTVRQGGTALGLIPVDADAQSFGVWVRAEQSGASTVTLSHANFRSLVLNLNAVERP